MSNEVDIRENDILLQDPVLLDILLIDHSRPKTGNQDGHIIWATDNYEPLGQKYQFNYPIEVESITGENGSIIQPRVRKTKAEQQSRARDKGEVFTPSWICNHQNNLIDNEWFGKKDVFNTETANGWISNTTPIKFPSLKGKTWQEYVSENRIEITCGEAPYLISRYDTITGDIIPIYDRIGLLDRKLRVLSENTNDVLEWFKWALVAYKSTYAYEWQGDNLLLARENALFTFFDYFSDKFKEPHTKDMARQIAEIISWNFWQMDGLKGVIPNSCHDEVTKPLLFNDMEEEKRPCPGCEKNNINAHNGIYCKIMDWEKNEVIRYISLLKR